jgi:hypothetical protein
VLANAGRLARGTALRLLVMALMPYGVCLIKEI